MTPETIDALAAWLAARAFEIHAMTDEERRTRGTNATHVVTSTDVCVSPARIPGRQPFKVHYAFPPTGHHLVPGCCALVVDDVNGYLAGAIGT